MDDYVRHALLIGVISNDHKRPEVTCKIFSSQATGGGAAYAHKSIVVYKNVQLRHVPVVLMVASWYALPGNSVRVPGPGWPDHGFQAQAGRIICVRLQRHMLSD